MSKKNHQNYTEPYAASHPPIGRIRTIHRLNCRGGFHPPAQYQPTIIDQVRRIHSTPQGLGDNCVLCMDSDRPGQNIGTCCFRDQRGNAALVDICP